MNNCVPLKIPNTEFHVINYPLIINNEENALQSLGGINTISEILKLNLYDASKKRIPLYLRSNMIYSKPLLGDHFYIKGILIKLKQLKNKKSGEIKVVPEILGYVQNIYEYTSLCDYQYNPHQSFQESSTVENSNLFYDKLVPSKPLMDLDEFESYINSNNEIFLPPLVFTKTEKPSDFRFKASQDVSKIIVKRKDFKSEKQSTELEFLNELFTLQPIWTTANLEFAMKEKNSPNIYKIRDIRCEIATHLNVGPWRRTWIKKDYDHKSHRESRMFQVLEFRGNASHIDIFKKYLRNSNSANNPELHLEASSIKIGPNHLPATVNCFYQLCNIDIPEVLELLSNEPFPDEPHQEYGWFTSNVANNIRRIINNFIVQRVELLMKSDNSVNFE